MAIPCEAWWVATEDMGPAFRAHYEMEARRGELRIGFEAVVEHTPERLVVVGFDRLGAQAFALHQTGTTIEIVLPARPGFHVHPITVLGAIHRVRFRDQGKPEPDGSMHVRACGIEIRMREAPAEPARSR